MNEAEENVREQSTLWEGDETSCSHEGLSGYSDKGDRETLHELDDVIDGDRALAEATRVRLLAKRLRKSKP
jgi:hypothetical protein